MPSNTPNDKQLVTVARQPEYADDAPSEQSIGDFLRQTKGLTDEQVEQILMHQRANKMRFGEAAIALQLANRDDVMRALSQQFHYPYAAKERVLANSELVVATNPFGEQAEAFRGMRSQLLADVLAPGSTHCALAVVSPNTGDGKTFYAANLAAVLSQLGAKTLLVDADLRSPRQHLLFKIEYAMGLSGILMGRESAEVIHQIHDLPSLFVLPAGAVPPNPLELVHRPAFGLLIHELLSKFDYVIVDTPAASHGSDAKVIAAKCGAAIAVGRKGTSRLKDIENLLSGLQRNATNIAGVVLNEH